MMHQSPKLRESRNDPPAAPPSPATRINTALNFETSNLQKNFQNRRQKSDPFLKPDRESQKQCEKLQSRLYNGAEESVILNVVRSRSLLDSSSLLSVHEVSNKKVLRTTFFKKDHKNKLEKRKLNPRLRLPPISSPSNEQNLANDKEDKLHPAPSQHSDIRSASSHISLGGSSEQEIWEDVQPSPINPVRIKVAKSKKSTSCSSLYDYIEPVDDDPINHMIRLRNNLNWRTMLPRHGPGMREAMMNTDDKNPLKEHLNLLKDSGEFVYAVERFPSVHRPNPFNLKVVSANQARHQTTFYTITASCVTKCTRSMIGDAEEKTDIYPVIWWLYEQRLYNMIYDLPVFANFRIWKQFSLWKRVVRSKKISTSSAVIGRTLFSASEVLLLCTNHISKMCEDACGSRDGFGIGDSAITFINYNKRCTYEFQAFCDIQMKQISFASEKLQKLKACMLQMAYDTCNKFAESYGITKDARLGKVQRRQYNNRVSIAEDTGPTFTQLAEWRGILARLFRFISFLDNMLFNMLHRLALTSVKCLHSFVTRSMEVEEDEHSVANLYSRVTDDGVREGYASKDILRREVLGINYTVEKSQGVETPEDENSIDVATWFQTKDDRSQSIKSDDSDPVDATYINKIARLAELEKLPRPLFLIKLELVVASEEDKTRQSSASSTRISSALGRRKSSVMFQVPDGLQEKDTRPRQGKRVSFPDILAASFNQRDERPKSYSRDDLSEDFETLSQGSSASKLSRTQEGTTSIRLTPTKFDFINGIEVIIDCYEKAISEVTALSREPTLFEFTKPPAFDLKLNANIEEENEQEETRREWPDLDVMLVADDDYSVTVEKTINIISSAVDSTTEYSHDFLKFCEMVDKSRNVDVEKSLAEHEWVPDDFLRVLKQHTDMVREIKGMEERRRIGIFWVESSWFANECLPFPQNVIDAVHRRLPGIAVRKDEELLRIIRAACKKLDKEPQTVEQFVEHLTFLARTATDMNTLEKEFIVVARLFNIIKEYNVKADAEDLALFQTLNPSFQHLKSTILFCEARKDENILKFSTDLETRIHDLRYQLFEIKNKVASPNLYNADMLSVVALESIKLLTEEVESLSKKARSYANYQDRFGSAYSKVQNKFTVEALLADTSTVSAQQVQAELSELERDLSLRKLLWESQDEWAKLLDGWKSTPFQTLNIDALQKNVNRFTQSIFMLDRGLPTNEIVPKLKESVLQFKQGVPVVAALRNPNLKQRHWDKIQYNVGRSIIRNADFTLGNFLSLRLFQHKDLIAEVSTQASNEATLENMLYKLINTWHQTDFKLAAHNSGPYTVMIITNVDDIITVLEESQVTIGTIKGSRYVDPIKSQVDDWDRRLGLFSHTLEEWMKCQRNWLYLEAIFTTADIQRQLPSDGKLFNQVDKSWKDLMRRVEDHPNALRSATAPGVLEILQASNTHLEKIHRSLEDYLEMKRLLFPRFYFLSNDELLDVLAQGRNPAAIQPHLSKCFANIRSLDIRTKQTDGLGRTDETKHHQPPVIKNIISAEGESIQMPKNVRARGPVEQWLGNVETAMYDTVKKHMKTGLLSWTSDLEEWVLQHPGQIVLTVAQILFNKDVVASLMSSNSNERLKNIYTGLQKSLSTLSGLVSQQFILSYQYLTLEALIIIYVHSRDIVNDMIKAEIDSIENFEWKRQLRYEWHEATGSCHVCQSSAQFHYGYEYIGCAPRLVITPLTDRCFLTLTGALSLHLGGSPAGPAGTGKSESVKDLAKVMGKQCVVFNCSKGVDYKMMGQFFSGLAQSGSWCCFDEFNRIDVEVLSVVASQFHTIKTAKDVDALRFMFEGREIRLNPSCGIFITMNPGYLGRVELPDNLKSLFRPVAMMVPDYALIAEIILYSEGFIDAKSLSRKIVNLYQLASKQLSQQVHYDFGMRAIKSVLIMAGQMKRRYASEVASMTPENQFADHDDMDSIDEERRLLEISQQEVFILIHALRDANLPKFLAEDVPLFESIMSDLFPGVQPPESDHALLENAVELVINEMGIEKWSSQIMKVVQLHSQLLVRHGVMLVGPSGGGKTMVREILQKALMLLPSLSSGNEYNDEKCGRRRKFIETYSINPKSVELGKLYGQTDPNTLEWSDGIFSHVIRKISREMSQPDSDNQRSGTSVSFNESEATRDDSPLSQSTAVSDITNKTEKLDPSSFTNEWRWVILDGPVDTMWVENLNTALDDTKTLCLANGERIALPEELRILFEVDNLSQASPATISRCAMVYLDPLDLGWKPYVKSWLRKLPQEMPLSAKHHLWKLFEMSIEPGLHFVQVHRKLQIMPLSSMNMVITLCRILEDLILFMSSNGGFGNPDELDENKDDERVSRSRRQSRRSSRVAFAPKSQSTGTWYMEKHPDKLTLLLGRLYVFAFTWSMGGTLNREDDQEDDTLISTTVIGRDEMLINMSYDFDHFIHDTFEGEPPLGVTFPSGSKSIFSYFIDMQTGFFTSWDELVPLTSTLIERGLSYSSMGDGVGLLSDHRKSAAADTNAALVPTTDTVKYSFLTALFLLNKQPVLLSGDSGVGKTALLQHVLQRLNLPKGSTTQAGTLLGDIFHHAEKSSMLLQSIASLGIITTNKDNETDKGYDSTPLTDSQISKAKSGSLVISTIQFSSQTSAPRVQTQILHKLVRRGRDTLGAPKGKRAIAFINDLNMPAPEKYGSQPPLELLRQFLELGGFYDMTSMKLYWKNITDVTIAACAAPTGGGRNMISQRLLKHFSVLAIPQPSTKSLQHIYQVQLGRFMEHRDFMPEVKECRNQVVSASIAVYYKMCNGMLPTPDKSHYTFNLRDLSAVIKGIFQANESVIVSRETISHLFAHEAMRVFHDRLNDPLDRTTFYKFLSDDLHNYFKITIPAEKLESEPFIFGDFLDVNAPTSNRIYRHLPDRKTLTTLLDEYYMRISSGNVKDIPLVFFNEAVEHVIRAARVFRQPAGHMLLVGIDGTGKVTTCKLAAQIAGCEVYRLSVVRGYSYIDFREELKKVFRLAGVENTPTVFLLTDSDIVDEVILEDINCILNTGEDPDLFDNEEIDTILMDVKQAAAAADVPDTQAAVYRFFLNRVYQNLHIVLTLSPAGSAFRQRCRTHPSLVNCCTIDWYDRWPPEALVSVANAYFTRENINLEHGLSSGRAASGKSERSDKEAKEDSADRIASVCVAVHGSASLAGKKFWEEMRRKYYITPSSYLEFIQVFTTMLASNKRDFNNNLDRLNKGLSTLSEARTQVGEMKQELVDIGPQMELKAKSIDKLMSQLKKDTEAVNQVREIVKQEEETMAHETKIVQDYAEQATVDLQSVLPALQEAVVALDALDKSDIAEIRVYMKPPELVLTVMSAVCILLQHKPDWPTAKHLLADPGFLRRLVTLDRDSLPDRVFSRLRKITKNPDFNAENVGKVSSACQSICIWVLALQHYNDVQRMVGPKQKRVKEAKEALGVAEANLQDKQKSLGKIQAHLDRLKQKFTDNIKQQEDLKTRKIVTAQRLRRASVLINALADEEVRWTTSVSELHKRLEGLIGDTIVSAASTAYLGAFTSQYRKQLVAEWLESCIKYNIPTSKDYNIIDAMADKNQIRTWHSKGLPRDANSIENAIIVKNTHRWPIMIDPQGQAVTWIKQMEGSNLQVVYAGDSNYIKVIENAVRIGHPVLLHDIDENIDPGLKPILQRDLVHRGGQDFIMFGDTEISYNNNFRLYMTTTKPNPHFLPAVSIIVTIINFTVTFEGLQDQLLSTVVIQERPQLEIQRDQLLESITNDLNLLRELENKSLNLLNTQKGHILDDEDLINTLKQSKVTSSEIQKRLEQSEDNEKRTTLARQKYLPVATRGAVLQFVIADLETLNSMYQFSLSWFIKMFEQCIADTSNKPSEEEQDTEDLPEVLQRMIDVLTAGVYKVVGYSLFGNHQLVFSFLLCTSVMRNNALRKDVWRNIGEVNEEHWQIFLHSRALASMMDEQVLAKFDGLTPMQRLEANAGLPSSQSSSRPTSSKSSKSGNGSNAVDEQQMMEITSFQRIAKGQPPYDWISSNAWLQCRYLSWKIDDLNKLCLSIVNMPRQWTLFKNSNNVFQMMATPYVPTSDEENEDFVFHWDKLSLFIRLMLVKILKPDELSTAMRDFIIQNMGEYFVDGGNFDLKGVFAESNPRVPLIFLLHPGTDPSNHLLRFGKEMRGSTLHIDMVSLGRGQGPKAEELIHKARILKGRWVFLQNCHLAASFMPRLQSIVEELSQENSDVDPQFRLFLSSKPDPAFPSHILQKGLKMTVEPPRGLRANLLASFGASGTGEVTRELYENPTLKRRDQAGFSIDVDEENVKTTWKKLLFSLCCFNAVVHERKKYGALGFNIPYEFTSSDLEVSILMLQQLISNTEHIPWAALHYLTGEVVYGGRVTDYWDRRCLDATLNKFYCADALNPDYKYSEDGVYKPMHKLLNFDNVHSYIDTLPIVDSPDVFGMHNNAEKAYMESEAQRIIDHIVEVQPRLASKHITGTSRNNDEVVMDLVVQIQKKLPLTVEDETATLDDLLHQGGKSEDEMKMTLSKLMTSHIWSSLLSKIKQETKESASTYHPLANSALLTVLRQEIDRFNTLLYAIHTNLHLLTRALHGDIVMSEALENSYNSLLMQKVPQTWVDAAYESCKPLASWVQDLIQRITFFSRWSELVIYAIELKVGLAMTLPPSQQKKMQDDISPQDEDVECEPRSFWLSSFFFPQGFLTAVLQNYARKYSIAVDSLVFEFIVKDTNEQLALLPSDKQMQEIAYGNLSSERVSEGVKIFGLYLDSAHWDEKNKVIVDSPPNKRNCYMPEIHFKPVPNISEKKTDSNRLTYESPLYKTAVRAGTLSSTGHSTNFVTAVMLPCNLPSEHWILRGVALLCQLND